MRKVWSPARAAQTTSSATISTLLTSPRAFQYCTRLQQGHVGEMLVDAFNLASASLPQAATANQQRKVLAASTQLTLYSATGAAP